MFRSWVKLVVAEYDAAASIFLTHEQNVNFNLTPVLAAVTLPPLLPTPRPYLHRCCAGAYTRRYAQPCS